MCPRGRPRGQGRPRGLHLCRAGSGRNSWLTKTAEEEIPKVAR